MSDDNYDKADLHYDDLEERCGTSKDDLRALIVLRIQACTHSCNGHHINRVEGQLEGLLAALTGDHVPSTGDAIDILKAAGIPFKTDGKGFEYDDAWLESVGFEWDREDEDAELHHPRWPDCW